MKKDENIPMEREAENMTLGERIKEQRKNAGMSQEKLAEQMGVSRQAVTKWESGQSAPSSDNLFKLAEILGCPVSRLLDNGDRSGQSPAEEVYYQLKLEQLEQTLTRQRRWLRNFRNAGLVLLAYLLLFAQQLIANGYLLNLLLQPHDLVYILSDPSGLSYLFGWLVFSTGLYWTSMLISAVPAIFGKYRFSVTTFVTFTAGIFLGELLGPNPEGWQTGNTHYGWAIWLFPFLWSILMGIVLEILARKGLKIRSRKFLIWLAVFAVGYIALLIMSLPPHRGYVI